MARQPYTYTLPELFLTDPSVPARWRVWAVINGFFISGQFCWASNEWIGEKVGAHKDTVSQAVKELEELKIVRCERGARSRRIYPMIGANAYQWSVPAPTSGRRQRLPITESNTVIEEEASPSFEVVQDQPEKEKAAPRDKEALRLRAKLYDVFAAENGVYPVINAADYYRVVAALKRLKQKDVEQLVEDGVSQGKRTVRECLTDRQIDIYLQDN